MRLEATASGLFQVKQLCFFYGLKFKVVKIVLRFGKQVLPLPLSICSLPARAGFSGPKGIKELFQPFVFKTAWIEGI